MKLNITRVVLVGCLLIGGILFFNSLLTQRGKGASQLELEQYKNAIRLQDEYHEILGNADRLLANKEYQESEKLYLKALAMAQGSSLEGVSRGALVRYYESTNQYDQALEQVEEILKKDITEPGRIRYSEIKARLLEKIRKIGGVTASAGQESK